MSNETYSPFETPPTKWEKRGVLLAIILFLVVSWGMMIFTCSEAKAQSSEPAQKQTETLDETSKCQPFLQIFKGLQLVQVGISPEDLSAFAIYYRKLADGKIILFRLLRDNCETPWRDGGVKVIPAPVCVETDSTKCL